MQPTLAAQPGRLLAGLGAILAAWQLSQAACWLAWALFCLPGSSLAQPLFWLPSRHFGCLAGILEGIFWLPGRHSGSHSGCLAGILAAWHAFWLPSRNSGCPAGILAAPQEF